MGSVPDRPLSRSQIDEFMQCPAEKDQFMEQNVLTRVLPLEVSI
jgi:hypothetical protein